LMASIQMNFISTWKKNSSKLS